MMRFYRATTVHGHTRGYSYGTGTVAFKMFMFLAVLGVPFWLFGQGHVWGQLLGIVAGLVIYPLIVAHFWSKLTTHH